MEAIVDIQRMGSQGQAVGYDSGGNVYFVRDAVVGDRVRVLFESESKRYRDAELVEILESSDHRQTPPCEYFLECGGCEWLHMKYPLQLEVKEASLTHILNRAALSPKMRLPIVGAKQLSGYRNRIQIRQKGNLLGFYKRRSNEIVDVESCYVAHPALNEAIQAIRARSQQNEVKQKTELYLDRAGEVHQTQNAPHAQNGFAQVNEEQNQALRRVVGGVFAQLRARVVLELYCGDGNLTACLGPCFERMLGIDNNPGAIESAKRQFQPGQALPGQYSFFCDTIDGKLTRRLPKGIRQEFDTVLLDPPRKGLPKGVLESLIHSRLENIIYVSCSPIAFTTNTRQLKKEGFALNFIQAIDMFPHTHHIEFVSWFSRAC